MRQLLIMVALTSLSCSSADPATRIVVRLNADGDVIANAKNVQLMIEGRASSDDDFEFVREFVIPAPVDQSAWPLQHVLEPTANDARRSYRVTARAFDASEEIVISQTGASSGYVKDQTRILRLHLPGGSCLNTPCGPDEACASGSCVAIGFTEPDTLATPDEPDVWPDASIDAEIDAEVPCPATACDVEDNACKTGVWDCTGESPVCVAQGNKGMGELCELTGDACDGPTTCTGICDGSGVCADAGCGDPCFPEGGNECKRYEVDCSSGSEVCTEVDNQAAGEPCGDDTANECDMADTCDGAGHCQANFVAKGVACGDRITTDCTQPDECDGEGSCDPLHLPDDTTCDKLHCRTGEKCAAGECQGGLAVRCSTSENGTCRYAECSEAAEGCTTRTRDGYCYLASNNSCYTGGQKSPNGCQQCSPPIWFAICIEG